jgi:hypothetical protein
VTEGRDDVRRKDRPGDRTSNKYAAKKAASERLAAERAAQQRAARNRNILIVGTSTIAVIAVIVVIVVVGVSQHKKGTSSANAITPAGASITDVITKAASDTSATPDFSGIAGPPKSLSGSGLNGSGGHPEVLYVGGEFCPNCAATRWSLAIALSRFGTLSDLKQTTSSEGSLATLSFQGSSYTSQYIDAVLKENEGQNHEEIDKLTSSEQSLFSSVGQNGYPFIDFGGKWAQVGTLLNPNDFSGKSHDDVVKAIGDPNSKLGKEIRAGADVYTAIICETTNNQPSDVCSSQGVKAAESALHGGK